MQFQRFQTEHTLQVDSETATLAVDIQDVRDDEETDHLYRIGILFLGGVDNENPGMARHDVIVCMKHGLEAWNFAIDGEKSWEKYAEMAQQKSCLLPVVVDWPVDLGVDVGTPNEAFGTRVYGLLG